MIPRETSKELFVTVENESITVAMSPPVLDSVVVSGVAPQQDQDSLIFEGYDPVTAEIYVRTIYGQEFTIGAATVGVGSPSLIPPQVVYGTGAPSGAPASDDGIYIDTANNSIWAWTP